MGVVFQVQSTSDTSKIGRRALIVMVLPTSVTLLCHALLAVRSFDVGTIALYLRRKVLERAMSSVCSAADL